MTTASRAVFTRRSAGAQACRFTSWGPGFLAYNLESDGQCTYFQGYGGAGVGRCGGKSSVGGGALW